MSDELTPVAHPQQFFSSPKELAMTRNRSRWAVSLIGILLILVLLASVSGYRTVRSSFPQITGELSLTGLDGQVDIYRDEFGIPQVYASSEHDLFFAQGYLHAQDRFWQMDFWRHIGSARLSEMFGENQLDTDKFLKTLGWARVAQQELDTIDPTSLAILTSYADGVNAYLADHQGSQISLEYAILKLLSPDYRPEPWQPLHSMTWAKVMAWDLGGNMDDEIYRAILSTSLSPEQLADIMPPYSQDAPVIVPDQNTASSQPTWIGVERELFAEAFPALQRIARRSTDLAALIGPSGIGIGSNNWVISGQLTTTGMPLLANDPHLGVQMPSIWYEVGLHCVVQSASCPYNVTGFSFAGAPGVIIGHNDRIAWGFTNVGPDVQDLFVEKINPNNPDQYEVNGEWVDMQLVQETIQVAGGESVPLTVRYTRNGPIISDTYEPLEGFTGRAGLELPELFAVSLRWTALEPISTFTAIWQFNRAGNWEEFREAAANFAVPSQNLVYADVDGNIGYQMPGLIPLRASGDGTMPVPGWTDDYQWTGFIPFDELPYAYNPPQGYIVTANNAVVGPNYPYLITTDWDYGYRAQRIVEMIENAPGPLDSSYIQLMQSDNKDLNAEALVPILLQLELGDPHLEQARSLFTGWDYQAHMDSAPAALFASFWKHLLAVTFHDELPKDEPPSGGSRWFRVLEILIEQPQDPWWDDQETPAFETRDQMLTLAFQAAVAELDSTLGNNPLDWTWGDLHQVTFQNASLGESGIAPIEALFNRGGFRTSGGPSIVNATGWDASESYQVVSLPSMRMIVDLGNLSASLSMHTTGQSGHAYHPNYIDMADHWRKIEYHPMLWDNDQVVTAAQSHLKLVP
jgi:penicillin G amidase